VSFAVVTGSGAGPPLNHLRDCRVENGASDNGSASAIDQRARRQAPALVDSRERVALGTLVAADDPQSHSPSLKAVKRSGQAGPSKS